MKFTVLFFFLEAMDAVEQEFMNLSDRGSVKVKMGKQPDLGSENTEDTNTSPAKKKARVIKLGKRTLRSPVWKTFNKLTTIFEDGLGKRAHLIFVMD